MVSASLSLSAVMVPVIKLSSKLEEAVTCRGCDHVTLPSWLSSSRSSTTGSRNSEGNVKHLLHTRIGLVGRYSRRVSRAGLQGIPARLPQQGISKWRRTSKQREEPAASRMRPWIAGTAEHSLCSRLASRNSSLPRASTTSPRGALRARWPRRRALTATAEDVVEDAAEDAEDSAATAEEEAAAESAMHSRRVSANLATPVASRMRESSAAPRQTRPCRSMCANPNNKHQIAYILCAEVRSWQASPCTARALFWPYPLLLCVRGVPLRDDVDQHRDRWDFV
eukprot:2764787-Rhodomonas_salina.1